MHASLKRVEKLENKIELKSFQITNKEMAEFVMKKRALKTSHDVHKFSANTL